MVCEGIFYWFRGEREVFVLLWSRRARPPLALRQSAVRRASRETTLGAGGRASCGSDSFARVSFRSCSVNMFCTSARELVNYFGFWTIASG